MLSKIYRLSPKSAIGKVVKRGQILKTHFFTLKFFKNLQKNPRFAFNIGLWIDKKATVRNKIKRKIRKMVLEILPKLQGKTYDCILTLRQKPKDLKLLKEDLEKCLKRLP